MTNMDKLYEAVEARGPVCVGLDTDFSYLPADFVDTTLTKGENIVRFNKKLIDATKAVAGCYKVQIAYYESLGLEGMKAYAETLAAVREAGIPVIADIKRGDIAKTAEMYAMGHFTGDFESDFVTLAPYMGLDSISPYLPYAEKQGKGLEDLSLAELQQLDARIADDVYAVLDYAAAVRRRETPAGTGPRSVARQIEQLRSWLQERA